MRAAVVGIGLLGAAWASSARADEIVVWHAWRGAEEAALTQAAADFRATTGHTVTLVPLPFGAFASKVETAIPRGNGPDVFLAAHDNLGKWQGMGLLAPVRFDADAHRPVAVQAVTRDGVALGVPLASKSILLLYDPSRITTPPTTTDELLALARADTYDDRYGLAWLASEPYFFGAWLHAFRPPDPTAPLGALDGPEVAAALAFNRRLAVDEGITPQQPTGELVGRLYGEGKVTFVLSGPWFVADQTRPVAAAPLPVVSETGRPATPYLTVDAAFLAAGTRNEAVAAAFIDHLAGPPGARVRAEVGGQAVTLRSQPPTSDLQRALLAQADHAVPMPSDPNLGTWFEAQARALRSTLRGSATPDVAADAARRWMEVLSRPPPPPSDPRPWLAALGLALVAAAVSLLRRAARPEGRAVLAAARRHRWDYAWILPAALPLAALVVLPFAVGATVSLFVHHQGTWTFVGLKNFVDIVLSTDWPVLRPMSFWFTLAVTLVWTAANLTLHVGIGVALALLLREPFIRLRPLWRALLILPWAIPNYITALIWKAMFHAQYGAINQLLGSLSGGRVELDWFGSFTMAFSANLMTNTWLGFPFMMVTTLGALQSIPRELEEAAAVDGASWWQRFRHVVWPLLRPALVPAILMGSVWTFNMFNVIYLVSAGEPDGATEILISDAYRWAFSRGNRYGYASAYAVLIFLVLLAYSRFANRLAGRRVL